MNRRIFAKTAITAVTAANILRPIYGVNLDSEARPPRSQPPFRTNFAPHYGQFKHSAGTDLLDQIRYAYDQGFTAWEDNRMSKRDPAEQKAIGSLLNRLGMTMGVFVIFVDIVNPVLTGNRLEKTKRTRDPKAVRQLLKERIADGIEVAKRCGAKWATLVPAAADPSIAFEYQTANVVEHLKYCSEFCEPVGLTLVIEPLNPINHPGLFLQRMSHAHQICKMVGSPYVKILSDLYHQQITEGNLITNLKNAWDEIAYIQIGDVPGRNEPTTGEINFGNIIKWLHNKGYNGVIGMEHGIKNKEKEGEKRLIEAYREIDPSS